MAAAAADLEDRPNAFGAPARVTVDYQLITRLCVHRLSPFLPGVMILRNHPTANRPVGLDCGDVGPDSADGTSTPVTLIRSPRLVPAPAALIRGLGDQSPSYWRRLALPSGAARRNAAGSDVRKGDGMTSEQTPGRRIVVGVDGSPSSKAALAWAVRQARLTGDSIEAVIAWHYPAMAGGVPFTPAGMMEGSDFGDYARTVLSDAIKEMVDPAEPVKVSSTALEGNAAQILLELAQGADLLVVGSRGHGGFTEALLGSVSQACVHHAPCPVVIIRAPQGSLIPLAAHG